MDNIRKIISTFFIVILFPTFSYSQAVHWPFKQTNQAHTIYLLGQVHFCFTQNKGQTHRSAHTKTNLIPASDSSLRSERQEG